MTNKPFPAGDTKQTAAELIDANVSFDFRAFLGKVSPAPSRLMLKREANQSSQAEPKQTQSNFQDNAHNSRG